MGFKYVVIRMTPKEEKACVAWELPFIFPDKVVHKDFADAVIASQQKEHPDMKFEVVSAGEVSLWVDSCAGESTTLNLKSRKDTDQMLISTFPYCHGIIDIGGKKCLKRTSNTRQGN